MIEQSFLSGLPDFLTRDPVLTAIAGAFAAGLVALIKMAVGRVFQFWQHVKTDVLGVVEFPYEPPVTSMVGRLMANSQAVNRVDSAIGEVKQEMHEGFARNDRQHNELRDRLDKHLEGHR